MANEVQKPGRDLGDPVARNGGKSDTATAEDDPKTWYGLVWRIVREVIESDEKLKRACVLIAVILVFIAVIGAVWIAVGVSR